MIALKYLDFFNVRDGLAVQSFAFAPYGNILAISDVGGGYYIWDIASSNLITSFVDLVSFHIEFNFDGTKLLLVARDLVSILDFTDSYKHPRTLRLSSNVPVINAHFNHDGSKVVVLAENRAVDIFCASFQKWLRTDRYENNVADVVFSPAGDKYAAIDTQGIVAITDLLTGECQYLSEDRWTYDIRRKVHFSKDGKRLLAVLSESIIHTSDLSVYSCPPLWRTKSVIRGASFVPTGDKIVVALANKMLILLDAASHKELEVCEIREPVKKLEFNMEFDHNVARVAILPFYGPTVSIWELQFNAQKS